jgi:threonine/homoserine/homoserine lactone efflux protein
VPDIYLADTYFSFLLFVIVATTTPGGATTLATASGIQFGLRRSVPLLIGVAFGMMILMALAASGLATVLEKMPVLSFAMKITGTGYLLWLAYQIGSAGRPNQAPDRQHTPVGFFGAMALLAVNPKAWAMSLGAAASFTSLAEDPFSLALIMGLTFGLSGLISLTLWCLGGVVLSNALRTDRHWRITNFSLGLLLVLSILPMWM